MLPRHETLTRLVDERHDCQDIGPAYVPGTVWGTASSQTASSRSRRRACLLIPASYQPASRRPGARSNARGRVLVSTNAITPAISDARAP